METEVMVEKQILFEEEVVLTGIREYGFSWSDFVQGISVPPAGARFDIDFQGIVRGEQLNGTITGVDYLEVRADGKLNLNLQASIVTDDGAHIKVIESGINKNGELRLNMQFHTGFAKYLWLNQQQVWGVGKVDFSTSKVRIIGYVI